jgi:hypothetical protein
VRIHDRAEVVYFPYKNCWSTVTAVIRESREMQTGDEISLELDRRLSEARSREQAEAVALQERERWDAYAQYKRELAGARSQRRQRWKRRLRRWMIWE